MADIFGNPTAAEVRAQEAAEAAEKQDNSPSAEEFAALQQKLEDAQAEVAKRTEAENDMNVRLARLEGRIEASGQNQQQQQEEDWRPTDEIGWKYARKTADLAVSQGGDQYIAAKTQIDSEYERWKEAQRETKADKRFARQRFLDEVKQAGVKETDPLYRLAETVVDADGDTAGFLNDVVSPLRTRVVEEANQNAADDTAEELASRTSIEEGTADSGQAAAEKKAKELSASKPEDVSKAVNKDVALMFRRYAPSSAKVFGK